MTWAANSAPSLNQRTRQLRIDRNREAVIRPGQAGGGTSTRTGGGVAPIAVEKRRVAGAARTAIRAIGPSIHCHDVALDRAQLFLHLVAVGRIGRERQVALQVIAGAGVV